MLGGDVKSTQPQGTVKTTKHTAIARGQNHRNRGRQCQRHTMSIAGGEKVMRSDRIGTRESSEVSPVSRSQGIEENENLEYSFLGFTQEN